MRVIKVRPFPNPVDPSNLGSLIKQRLQDDMVCFPSQAVELVGIMAWPNNEVKRELWGKGHLPPRGSSPGESDQELADLRGFWVADQQALASFRSELRKTQQHWARIADIVHLHHDLSCGGHQKRRLGVSVGKAIALIDANAKSKGTGAARLWELWTAYKDSAHLICAAILISDDARARCGEALDVHRLAPYQIAMLLPDLVFSVAMALERYGLASIPHSRDDSMLATESLWRVPADINLVAIDPPARHMTTADLAVLHARRAGNRGKTNAA
jgi:hypothetical protein